MTFYEKVLQEYLSSELNDYFICHRSTTFISHWQAYKYVIRFHASFFLDNDNFKLTSGNDDKLFIPKSEFHENKKDLEQIRIEFLNWCIKNKLDL